MPPLKNSEIAELADEWGRLQLQAIALADKCLAEIGPITEEYNATVAGIETRYGRKISKLTERQREISQAIHPALHQRKADTAIEGEIAIAERKTETKVGPRIIDFLKFWKKAKPLGQAAVDCVNVQVGAAEKLLGKKTIDAMSTKKETVETTVRIRLKDTP